ncbi:hypothetical protein EHI2019_000519700 [Entamoeba histolytica]
MKETNTYINDIRDDVSQLSTLNTTNMNEINNLTNQLISLSSLVNTSLYSPFYSNEEALLKMTSLTSYINTEISRNTTIKQADIINTIGIKDLKNITYTFPLSTLMSWGTDSSKTFKNTSTDHKMYIFQFMFMINTDTDSTKKTKIYFNSNRIDQEIHPPLINYLIYVSTVGVYILNYTDGTLTYKNAVDIVQSSPNQSFIYYIDSKTPFDSNFISGSIGVGKTTTIQALIEYFNKENVGIIEEYIDYSPRIGKMLISDVGNGIERNYTLQKFILQCYEEQLKNNKNKKVIIIERHPREAIEVFCEIDKTMTEKEREEITNKIYLIEKEYQLEYNKYNTYCISTDYATPNL